MAVGIDSGQRSQDVVGGVRNQGRVVVSKNSSVVLQKIQQMRHLLQVRGHVLVVTQKMRIVKLDINHMFDPPVGRI